MSFVYDSGFHREIPTIIYGDGDDLVNRPVLEVYLRWANSGYPFNRTIFQGVDYSAIVSDELVLQAIGRVVGAPVDPINGVFHALSEFHTVGGGAWDLQPPAKFPPSRIADSPNCMPINFSP